MSTLESEKISFWRRIGYGLGDIYGGGSGVLLSFYYLYFLTDVVRINPSLAGTVILISKIYDSITDPLEGTLADRTRTRWGRRRPYLAAGVVMIFLSIVGVFYPAGFSSEMARFFFALAGYLFFSTVVSIVMLNYNALQSELSLDYDVRTQLSSVRIAFSTISSILAAILPLEIVKLFPDVRDGYLAMGITFGLLFSIPMLVTVFSVRERPEFQRPPQPFHWKAAFIEPFRMRTFVIVLIMYLLAFTAMDAVSSLVIYFMKYYLNRPGEANFVSGALLIAQVVSLPFYVWLSRRSDKRTGYLVGAVAWMASMVLSLFIAPGQPAWIIYAFAALVGLSTGGIVIMIYAMFPDIPDVDELVSGERREGIYSALVTFVRKFSSALAIFIISNVIAATGYLAPVETLVDGVSTLVEQPQPEAFLLALRLLFAFTPIVLLVFAILAGLRYPLDHLMHHRLQAVLERQRSEEPLSASEQAEEKDLRLRLYGG